MKIALFLFSTFLSVSIHSLFAQNISGKALLNKAINYHDPNGHWSTFNGELHVTMETPNHSDRDSKIIINLPQDYFYVSAKRDSVTTEYTLDKGECKMRLNGSEAISEAQLKTHNLSCDRAKLYKNYYTYLYGLPMKLKDEGTIIHDKVELKTFQGKAYLMLKASYEKHVGSDVWFFYFDPNTYAMEVYQFFKTDEHGALKKDSGEYILLTETQTINAIKMPKNRAWYYNKDNGYLGTDKLSQ